MDVPVLLRWCSISGVAAGDSRGFFSRRGRVYGSGARGNLCVGKRLVSQFKLAIVACPVQQRPVNPTFRHAVR